MKKILVIEDEAQSRDIFLECLEAEGFNTLCAENGRVGIQIVQEQLPDLVICDIVMPELDGYGVLSTLRQDPVTAIIPFIFLTAKATKAEFRQGMELGADDYLTKPSTAEELLRAIAARLEKQTALQQWYADEFQQNLELPPANVGKLATPKSIFPSNSRLRKVFDFIEANYHEPIRLCDVAQAAGYSPAYLTDLVRRQTGEPVHRWIVKRRMTAAHTLLLGTNQTASQIANAVGYQDAGHFSRQFRQYNGITPQAWRKAHQAQFSTNQEQNDCFV